MRPEDRLLVIGSRRQLDGEHRQAILALCRRYRLNWNLVCSTAAQQGVAPLLHAHLATFPRKTLGVPEDIQARLRSLFVQNLVWKERQAAGLVRTLALLNGYGIGAMLVKGAALDLVVYGPNPYTSSRDIDLVLPGRRETFGQAERAAIDSIGGPDAIEYDFYEHHDLTIDGVLPIDFRQIWAEAITADYRGQRVLLMCPEDMLIAACISCCRHHFLRLKNLCDIAEITRAFPALKWRVVAEKAQAQACANIVYAALTLTERTVGCQVPAAVLNGLKVGPARRVVINTTGRLLLRLPLAATEAGIRRAGRQISLSLLLPYVAYDAHQVYRKLAYLRARRPTRVTRLRSNP